MNISVYFNFKFSIGIITPFLSFSSFRTFIKALSPIWPNSLERAKTTSPFSSPSTGSSTTTSIYPFLSIFFFSKSTCSGLVVVSRNDSPTNSSNDRNFIIISFHHMTPEAPFQTYGFHHLRVSVLPATARCCWSAASLL